MDRNMVSYILQIGTNALLPCGGCKGWVLQVTITNNTTTSTPVYTLHQDNILKII